MTSCLTRSLSIALVMAASVAQASPGLEVSLERARAVIEEIRKLTPKPVRVLINSHWHQDHWSGNDEYLKAFPGLRIVASAETRAYMSRMAPGFFVGSLEQIGLPQRREALATAMRTGKTKAGSAMTAEARERMEREIATSEQFVAEVKALPRVLPNVAFQGEMTFWSGRRELRLMSVTGDATGSTVLYLPGSKVLATGDVLVSPEDGRGRPPGRRTPTPSRPGWRACAAWRLSTPGSWSRARARPCTTRRTCAGRSSSSPPCWRRCTQPSRAAASAWRTCRPLWTSTASLASTTLALR